MTGSSDATTPQDDGGRPPRPWAETMIGVGMIAVALVILQAAGWRLDPPFDMPNGIYARDLYVEGAFKAHEARRWALFGEWSTNDADNYRFWLVQSPAHVWPLALWLKTFGVTWSNLRLYSVLTYAIGWLALLAAAFRGRRDAVAIAITVGMLGDFYLRHAARSALIEVPLTSIACLAFVASLAAVKHPRWVFALPVLGTLGVLTKQSGVFLAGYAVGAALIIAWRHRHHPALKRTVAAWIGLCAVLSVGLLAYALSDEYWRTIEWNTNHMLGSDDNRTESISASHLNPLPILARLVDPFRWRDAFLAYFPVSLPLALVQVGAMIRDARRGRKLATDDLLAAWMTLCAFGLLQLTHQIRLRFSLLLFPFLWWMAGRGAMTLWRAGGRIRILSTLTVVGLFAATHGWWNIRHLANPNSILFDNNDALADTLGPGDRLVGKSAPWMAFNTRADHYVLRAPFNCHRGAVLALKPTHVLRDTRREYTRRCLRRYREDWLAGVERIASVPWVGRDIHLLKWPMDEELEARREELSEVLGDAVNTLDAEAARDDDPMDEDDPNDDDM